MPKLLHKIIRHTSLPSTNTYCMELVKLGEIEPYTVVVANNQTNGKGQNGNKWHSKDGLNLTFSLYVPHNMLKVENQFALNKAIAIGLNETISTILSTTTYIKWPNDIIVNDEKIAGILIENIIQGSYLSKTIVGIGINVNQTSFEIEKANPTSLYLQTGQKHIIDEVMFKVLEKIMEQIEFLHDKEFTNINENYDACLYKKDEICLFEMGEKRIEAKIEKVDNKGALVVSNKSGIYTKNHGEIKLVIA